jgi:hypothetical protein
MKRSGPRDYRVQCLTRGAMADAPVAKWLFGEVADFDWRPQSETFRAE